MISPKYCVKEDNMVLTLFFLLSHIVGPLLFTSCRLLVTPYRQKPIQLWFHPSILFPIYTPLKFHHFSTLNSLFLIARLALPMISFLLNKVHPFDTITTATYSTSTTTIISEIGPTTFHSS